MGGLWIVGGLAALTMGSALVLRRNLVESLPPLVFVVLITPLMVVPLPEALISGVVRGVLLAIGLKIGLSRLASMLARLEGSVSAQRLEPGQTAVKQVGIGGRTPAKAAPPVLGIERDAAGWCAYTPDKTYASGRMWLTTEAGSVLVGLLYTMMCRCCRRKGLKFDRFWEIGTDEDVYVVGVPVWESAANAPRGFRESAWVPVFGTDHHRAMLFGHSQKVVRLWTWWWIVVTSAWMLLLAAAVFTAPWPL